MKNFLYQLFLLQILVCCLWGEEEINRRAAYRHRLWPEGKIPYVITGNFDKKQLSLLKKALNVFCCNTCVRWIPRTKEKNFVNIKGNRYQECVSSRGRVLGEQSIKLGAVCFKTLGDILHQLMHTIGFIDEILRPDRDNYITIATHNIKNWAIDFFKKKSATKIDTLGVEYDFESVMHFPTTIYSKNGKPTIIPKKNVNVTIGQRRGLSKKDVEKIKIMYNC